MIDSQRAAVVNRNPASISKGMDDYSQLAASAATVASSISKGMDD